ncbi:MAG: type II toxin-antitoxin system VapC family toxin [Candidatus Saccharimonas sp.]|nr:type II toxin-antitoxin system VapC family toxin [Planctomycetaceae bacterium]
MTKYLLDTNAAADMICNRRHVDVRALMARQQGHVIGTATPVIAELLGGIDYSQSRERNLLRFNRKLSMFRLWPFTLEIAREYGKLYAELRRTGNPMQVIDMMVAATARTLSDCIVVTTDGDLLRVPNLRVENWAV